MKIVAWLALALFVCSRLSSSAEIVEHATDDTAHVVAFDGRLATDGTIGVTVAGLREWSRSPGHSPWRLVPYLQGKPLNGLYPTSVNLRRERLQYDLDITPSSQAVWIHALSPPTIWRDVRFSVGLENEDPLDTQFTEQHPARLAILNPYWAIAAIVVTFVCASLFAWLSLTTSLLTEPWFEPGHEAGVRYSLAKIQLAVWFFVIFTSFIVIWLATGSYDTINLSVISLLGISSGTALGDAYIRSRMTESRPPTSGALGAAAAPSALVTLEPSVASNTSAACNASASPDASRTVAAAPPSTDKRPVRYLFHDVLSDGDGYSIYRFQMLAWTVALLMVFLASTYYRLKMPTFNVELLYLLGLSSGTFVANRIPESQWRPSQNERSLETVAVRDEPVLASSSNAHTYETAGGPPASNAHNDHDEREEGNEAEAADGFDGFRRKNEASETSEPSGARGTRASGQADD